MGTRVEIQIAHELLRSINAGDVNGVVALFDDGYAGIDVADPTPQRGRVDVRRSIERYREAFPDLRVLAETTVTEDERIALFWTAIGTHRGPLMHIPPTGRPVEVRGVALLRIEREKIVEGLYLWDVAGLLRSVGLLPDLSIEAHV